MPQNTAVQYQERYLAVSAILSEGGFYCDPYRSGASLWAKLPAESPFTDSCHFCEELLRDAGVICSSGSVFGSEYSGFIRIALVQPIDVLQQAARSIVTVMQDAVVSSNGHIASRKDSSELSQPF